MFILQNLQEQNLGDVFDGVGEDGGLGAVGGGKELLVKDCGPVCLNQLAV